MWRYVRALDSMDPDGYAAVFTEDGTFGSGSTQRKGPRRSQGDGRRSQEGPRRARGRRHAERADVSRHRESPDRRSRAPTKRATTRIG